MTRAIFIVAISSLLCIVGHARAEGGYHPPREMIQLSEFVAIISIDRVTPLPKPERPRWHFGQRAHATVERNVKGALTRSIDIYGDENFVCQKTDLSPGRYLAFLVRSREGHLESANYQMGVRPIRGDSVEWYYREGDPLTPLFGYKLRWQRLDPLLRSIDTTLRPNQAMEPTTGRGTPKFFMTLTSYPAATPALASGGSSCSR